MDLAPWLERLQAMPPWAAWGTLALAALIEYVFPPFPGDVIVIAGAVLVGALGWSAPPVFLAVTAGAVLGSAIDFQAGRWLASTGRLDRMDPRRRAAVDDLLARFRTWGPAYLALNRFVPGVRALFFVAAGLAGLRWPQVLLWSTVSAVAWNLILVGLGFTLGTNLDALERGFRTYNLVALTLVFSLVVAWGVSALRSRGT